MRNTVLSRNSLRSAHLKRLEETKAHLNEIKNKVSEKLVASSKADMDFPNMDTATAADLKELIRLKTPGERKEEFLSRMNSSKSIHISNQRAK